MKKPLVYLLDDDPAFTFLMDHVLKKLGMNTQTFHAPEELYQRMKEVAPQLCIVDLNLGGALQGFDIIKAIRQKISPTLPIMVISSDAESKSVAHAIEIGANDYLFKPLNRQILLDKVSSFVMSPELETNLSGAMVELESRIKTQASLEMRILEIEETGISLASSHLVSKGTVVNLNGQLVEEILGKPGYILATTVASSVDKGDQFTSYLEFYSFQPEVPNLVRTWILNKTSGTS